MNEGFKKSLPALLLTLVGGGGASLLLYSMISSPNPAVEKLAASSDRAIFNKSSAHDEEDGSLPSAVSRARAGREASSPYSDANYGKSSLELVGGELPLQEALELEGGRVPYKGADGESGGSVGTGLFGAVSGGSMDGSGSSWNEEVGGFDRKKSAIDETAGFYGKQGGMPQDKLAGKDRKKNPLLASAGGTSIAGQTGGNAASVKMKGSSGALARTNKMGLRQMGNRATGTSKNAAGQLKSASGYVTGAVGSGSNFQTSAGAMGHAMDGVGAASVIEGITNSAEGISANSVPSIEDAVTPSGQGSASKKPFEWSAHASRIKYLNRDWSEIGDYSTVYAETVGLGGILSQYLGFPGIVLGYTSGAGSSSFSNYFRCGRRKCGCKETYTTYVQVKVDIDGKEKIINSRASPFTATCSHKRHSCHGEGTVKEEETIPFGESRFVIIYSYFQHHASGMTGYLLNIANVKANREPMFVPINATGDRAYNLGPCLRKLAEEFAGRCGIGTLTQMGLIDKFTEQATETDGGVRGVCVQHYSMPQKFEACVNTGEWLFAGSSN